VVKSAALAVALSTVACSAAPSNITTGPRPTSYRVHVSPDFTADQQAIAVAAVDAWVAAVPGLQLDYDVSLDTDGIRLIPEWGLPLETGRKSDELGETDYLSASSATCKIEVDWVADYAASVGVDPAIVPTWLLWTFEHELGHAMMGPLHLATVARMLPSLNGQPADISPADVAHFWETR